MLFTEEYFNAEAVKFFGMCGDRNSTLRELELARRAVFFIYMNADGNVDRMAVTLETVDHNYLRRLPFFERKEGTFTHL